MKNKQLKRIALRAEQTGTSTRNPDLRKYKINYIDTDGTKKETFAYGEDMESALTRVKKTFRQKDLELIVKKNSNLINIVLILSIITVISVFSLVVKTF